MKCEWCGAYNPIDRRKSPTLWCRSRDPVIRRLCIRDAVQRIEKRGK